MCKLSSRFSCFSKLKMAANVILNMSIFITKSLIHRLKPIQMPVYMSSLMNAGKHIYTINLCVRVFMFAGLLSPILYQFFPPDNTISYLISTALSMSEQENWTLGYAHTHTHRVIVYICLSAFIKDDMQAGICIDINLWLNCSVVVFDPPVAVFQSKSFKIVQLL